MSSGGTTGLLAIGDAPAREATAMGVLAGLAAAPLGLAVFDLDLRLSYVNAWMAEANGLPVEAHLGRTLGELFPGQPGPVAAVERRVRAVLDGAPPCVASIAASRADGSRGEWVATYFPVLGPGRDIRGACGVVVDVTADREREAAIARARGEAERTARRLAYLQEVTAALSAASDAPTVAEAVVDRARRMVGATAVTLRVLRDGALALLAASRDVDPVVGSPPVPADADAPASAVAARGEPIWLEDATEIAWRFPGLGAGCSACAALAVLPLAAGGRRIGTLGFAFDHPRAFDLEDRAFLLGLAEQCAVALDRARLLEDERRAREEAERARADADRAHALLDALVENAPLGIGVFDRQLRFQWVNPRLAEIDGVPVHAHLGKTRRELLPGLPPEAAEAAGRRVLETGEPLLDVELAGEIPGAGRRTWLESWYPVRSGADTGAIGVLVRDVTRDREAEEFQRHVAAVVGHDLGGPLTAVTATAQLLLRQDLPPPQARLVARIARSAGRADEIARALLDLARVRGGRGVPLERTRCDAGEIARGVAEECSAARSGRQVRCEADGDCGGAWDADRIAQLLTNLVLNALDYSLDGVPVWIRCGAREQDVVLEVVNAGPVLPPDLVPRLFEPFRRGDGARRGGVGLGLFIARAIARAHGGDISVRSSAAEGTVFSVRLPRG